MKGVVRLGSQSLLLLLTAVLPLPATSNISPPLADFSTFLFASDAGLQVGSNRRTISMQRDGDREYLLYIPSGIVDPPALILNFHGLPAFTSEFQEFFSASSEVADDMKNFIVVYPQGASLFNTFDAGTPCCDLLDHSDDISYSRAIIEDVKNSMKINLRRIYSYGFSQGGAMSIYLSYKIPEYIAAISTNAFPFLPEYYEEAVDAKETDPNFHPVPVLAIHGYNDLLICWEEDCISNIAFSSFNTAKE